MPYRVILQWVLTAFCISLVLTPAVRAFARKKHLFAQQNERTVHQGHIPRLGGIAIYSAFMITILLTQTITKQIMGILIGMTFLFIVGVIDDLKDLSAKTKLIAQIIASLILIYFGIQINVLRLPFGIILDFGPINFLLTIGWIVGITNAINLIDGLDGLAGGMTSIILTIIGLTATIEGKAEIALFAFILTGSIGGFLLYNAHPASIFMGDCGSLILGYAISALSLLGFKTATVMTLALPILILMIPIMDTISAILRRTLKHMKFSSADKEHIHHQLMRRFGVTKSVLIMCGMTTLFGLSAYIYMIDKEAGLLLMFLICVILELFVEKTGMISEHFHPCISAWRKFKKIFITT